MSSCQAECCPKDRCVCTDCVCLLPAGNDSEKQNAFPKKELQGAWSKVCPCMPTAEHLEEDECLKKECCDKEKNKPTKEKDRSKNGNVGCDEDTCSKKYQNPGFDSQDDQCCDSDSTAPLLSNATNNTSKSDLCGQKSLNEDPCCSKEGVCSKTPSISTGSHSPGKKRPCGKKSSNGDPCCKKKNGSPCNESKAPLLSEDDKEDEIMPESTKHVEAVAKSCCKEKSCESEMVKPTFEKKSETKSCCETKRCGKENENVGIDKKAESKSGCETESSEDKEKNKEIPNLLASPEAVSESKVSQKGTGALAPTSVPLLIPDDPYDDTRPLLKNTSVNAAASDTTVVDVNNFEPVRRTTKLRVQNICCPKEATIVEDELNKLQGIFSVRVNVIGRIVHVSHRPDIVSPTELVNTLNKRHLGASIVDTGEEAGQTGFPTSLKLLLLLLFLQAVLFSIALGARFTGHNWSMWVSIAVICIGAFPVFKKAAFAIWNTHIDLNVLITITVIGTLAIQEWLDGAAVVFVFALADFLQQFCFYRVHKTISSLMLSKPSKAVLASNGECLPIEQIPIGSVIAVRQGELIPLDGVVVKGSASVDESSISGEAAPVEKTPNTQIFSGTVIQHGYLEIETTSTATSSTISKITEMVEDAQMNSSPTEILVNKFAKYYTPLVVLLAVLVFLIPLFLGLGGVDPYEGQTKTWGERALIVLVTACPCALLMATPIVVIGGINTGARLGALIKGGTFLEGLEKLTFLAFDKTGTLTEGKFQVVDIIPLSTKDENYVLRLTAALESKSSHPLAAAVVSKFAGECIADFVSDSEDIQLPEVSDFCTQEGRGISGTVEGHRIEIGNKALLKKLGLSLSPKHDAIFDNFCNESKTVIFACVDGELGLMISLADIIRGESREALGWLQDLNVQLAMLTGDSKQTASAVKKDLKLNFCISEMKPDDKLKWITETKNEVVFTKTSCFRRKRNHVVGMVGDGVNDGPALAAANVGIAMAAGGSALAVEAAGVALMTNSVLKVPEIICLSRFCRRVIVQNVVLVIILKLAFVIVALQGYVRVWMAVLGDLAGLLAVLLNGLRTLRWKPPTYKLVRKTPPNPRVSWKLDEKPEFQYNTFE